MRRGRWCRYDEKRCRWRRPCRGVRNGGTGSKGGKKRKRDATKTKIHATSGGGREQRTWNTLVSNCQLLSGRTCREYGARAGACRGAAAVTSFNVISLTRARHRPNSMHIRSPEAPHTDATQKRNVNDSSAGAVRNVHVTLSSPHRRCPGG